LLASTDYISDSDAEFQLEKGWDAATETLFKNYIAVHSNTPTAYEQATQLWPDVYNYYRIRINKNPFAGTKWGDLSNDGYLRLKPHQLTSFNQSASSPLGVVPREIIVEVKMTDEEYDGTYTLTRLPQRGEDRRARAVALCDPLHRPAVVSLRPVVQIPSVRDQGAAGQKGSWTVPFAATHGS